MMFLKKNKIQLLALFFVIFSMINTDLSALQSAYQPRIGIDSSGNAVSIWQIIDDSNVNLIQASTKTVSGNWTTPVTISNTDLNSYNPILVVNSQGDAVAIWTSTDTSLGIDTLCTATLPFGDSWTTEVNLSGVNQQINSDQRVSINGSNVVVIWSAYDINSSYSAIFSASGVVGDSWDTPVQVSP